MTALIPNRRVVSETWEAYAKLCQAAAQDPLLLSDAGYTTARDNAHKRWSEAFSRWDGR